jgi:hypothetical protein
MKYCALKIKDLMKECKRLYLNQYIGCEKPGVDEKSSWFF